MLNIGDTECDVYSSQDPKAMMAETYKALKQWFPTCSLKEV